MPSPRYWREIPARYRLEATRCTGCRRVHYPGRTICPYCRATRLEAMPLTPGGKVVCSTVVHVPPSEFVMEAPYAMALVETPEGARLMLQVVDCDAEHVQPGLRVRLEFRRIRREGRAGILCYGHKAVPAEQER